MGTYDSRIPRLFDAKSACRYILILMIARFTVEARFTIEVRFAIFSVIEYPWPGCVAAGFFKVSFQNRIQTFYSYVSFSNDLRVSSMFVFFSSSFSPLVFMGAAHVCFCIVLSCHPHHFWKRFILSTFV